MEEIHQVIAEIELKITHIKSSLQKSKSENLELNMELQLLKEKLSKRETEARDFKNKWEELQHQIEQGKVGYSNEGEEEKIRRSVEIDALVKEIDECINKLKE